MPGDIPPRHPMRPSERIDRRLAQTDRDVVRSVKCLDTQQEAEMENGRRDFSLREAARAIDANAAERSIGQAIEGMGLDMAEVLHVAEQRAMRLMLVVTGRTEELRRAVAANDFSTIRFREGEMKQIDTLQLAYLDGLAIGWRGHQLHEEE